MHGRMREATELTVCCLAGQGPIQGAGAAAGKGAGLTAAPHGSGQPCMPAAMSMSSHVHRDFVHACAVHFKWVLAVSCLVHYGCSWK